MLPDPETCRRLARDVGSRWIWMPRMLTRQYGYIQVERGVPSVYRAVWGTSIPVPADALPDLTDPLTAAGALLVARTVWASPSLCVVNGEVGWMVRRGSAPEWLCADGRFRDPHPRGLDVSALYRPTELEVLIAAILAAPEK